jgi:hypothetical protein
LELRLGVGVKVSVRVRTEIGLVGVSVDLVGAAGAEVCVGVGFGGLTGVRVNIGVWVNCVR